MIIKSFDQLRIIPNVSDIRHRSECDTGVNFGPFSFDVPLFVASMHSLVSTELIRNVEKIGGGIIQPRHNYWTCENQMISCSLDQAYNFAKTYHENNVTNVILSIEIANGYMMELYNTVEKIKKEFPEIFVLAGTVCEYSGSKNLENAGADAILLGIGCGEVCETTIITGVGLPAVTSLLSLRDSDLKIPIILSGGVRTYADFCKAIALGADIVMSGSLFKNCKDTESPGKYWGEASITQKVADAKFGYYEGKEMEVKVENKLSGDVVIEAKQALQSSMSYTGARNLKEFRQKVRIQEI